MVRVPLMIVVIAAMVAMGAGPTPATLLLAQAGVQATPSEQDLVRWAFTQGALALVLVLVLISYRRDFFRKLQAKQAEIDLMREERREMVAVLKEIAATGTKQAVAVAENTKATELLAQNVNNLAERRGHPR